MIESNTTQFSPSRAVKSWFDFLKGDDRHLALLYCGDDTFSSSCHSVARNKMSMKFVSLKLMR